MTTKTLVYKVARFNKELKGKNLQSLITLAFQKKKSAVSRRQQADSENHFRLINYHGPNKGMRVGEFFDYTHGHKQPMAKFEEEAEELEISSLAPPDKMTDFLHSILYFGIWENSVILSQSMSLRAPQFEAYLNWLLIDCELLGEDDFLSLCDNPPLNLASDVVNTKGIEFHAPVTFEPIKQNKDATETRSIAFRPNNIGWDILKQIIPAEITLPTEIKASEVILNSALDVKLFVSWSKLRKDDSTEMLDKISNQLRHVDSELDYTILTKSGKITRDDFKLRRPISVGMNNDGLVKKSDMWERMQEWLEILITEEKIVHEG